MKYIFLVFISLVLMLNAVAAHGECMMASSVPANQQPLSTDMANHANDGVLCHDDMSITKVEHTGITEQGDADHSSHFCDCHHCVQHSLLIPELIDLHTPNVAITEAVSGRYSIDLTADNRPPITTLI